MVCCDGLCRDVCWKWHGVLCGSVTWSVVDGSVVCAVLCGAVWCVRMIEVTGCDVQGGTRHSGRYIDVLCRWCVLRCGMPYTLCRMEHVGVGVWAMV